MALKLCPDANAFGELIRFGSITLGLWCLCSFGHYWSEGSGRVLRVILSFRVFEHMLILKTRQSVEVNKLIAATCMHLLSQAISKIRVDGYARCNQLGRHL